MSGVASCFVQWLCHVMLHHGYCILSGGGCSMCGKGDLPSKEPSGAKSISLQHDMTEGLTTKDYIEDYCIYRIRQEGPLPNYEHVRDDPCNAVAARIREIGTEIENKNPDFFARVCEQLNVSPNTAYAQFKDLADELFRDQTNGHQGQGASWGRIAALIAFSGRLSLHCATHDMEDMVPSVIGWTQRYLDTHLNSWMRDHNNWAGFLQFFDPTSQEDRAKEALEGFMKKAFTYAAVGVAVVGLASMIMKKS